MMKFFELTVNVVSGEGSADRSSQMYMLSATCGAEMWDSPLYDEDQYRRSMSGTGLTAVQIETPILQRTQTVFGGRGGGELLFTEEMVRRMGLEPLTR